MAISVKNLAVERDVRRLADILGVDLTQAIGFAVSNELRQMEEARAYRLVRMRSIADELQKFPVLRLTIQR